MSGTQKESAGGRHRGRFSVQRKSSAVLRLLKGEDLEVLSRELGVTASKLSQWREQFLAGGQANLKIQPSHRESGGNDRHNEVIRLKAKVGELTMDNELLNTKIDQLETRRPLGVRRLSR